jgi:hypothetical protein
MGAEASAWPIRPFSINSTRGGRRGTKPLLGALLAKALIVDQPQGGGGDQQWWEWPGAARIANPLIVWELYGERDPTQWRERPWSRTDRRSAHCVGALWGEGCHTMREMAWPGEAPSPKQLMHNQLRSQADPVGSRWRTVGTRRVAGLGREEGRGSVQAWPEPFGSAQGELRRGHMASRRRTVGTRGLGVLPGRSGEGVQCEGEPLWGILSKIEPERAGSPKREGWHSGPF